MKIAILTRRINAGASKAIKKEILKRGHEVLWLNPEKIVCQVSNQVNGNDTIYHLETGQRIYKKEIDSCIVRIGGTGHKGLTLLRHLESMGIPCTCSSVGALICGDKLLCHQILSKAKGIRNPKTLIMPTNDYWEFYAKKMGGFPLVVKRTRGSQGANVYVHRDIVEARMFYNVIKNERVKGEFLFQEFLDSRTENTDLVSDIRVFCIEGEISASMLRQSSSKSNLRANLSQGGTGESIKLTKDEITMVKKVISACDMDTSICGVDLLRANNGLTYVIENNSCPGHKCSEYTGVDVTGLTVDFAERLSGTENENDVSMSAGFGRLKFADNTKLLVPIYDKEGNIVLYANTPV